MTQLVEKKTTIKSLFSQQNVKEKFTEMLGKKANGFIINRKSMMQSRNSLLLVRHCSFLFSQNSIWPKVISPGFRRHSWAPFLKLRLLRPEASWWTGSRRRSCHRPCRRTGLGCRGTVCSCSSQVLIWLYWPGSLEKCRKQLQLNFNFEANIEFRLQNVVKRQFWNIVQMKY